MRREDTLWRALREVPHGGLSTGPKTPAGKATISAANTEHGRYKNWREKRVKERYYRNVGWGGAVSRTGR